MLAIQKTFKNELPTIYMVGTPIGNMDDISHRALETLNSVDVIMCEDTRTSSILLKKYNINKPLVSLHKFNETGRVDDVINMINEHKNIAIISDAGVPAISDPGAQLINILRWKYQVSVNVSAVNAGPAYIHAIAMSGFVQKTNYFYGFIENKNHASKVKELTNVKSMFSDTIVSFYESVHRIKDTLEVIAEVYDKNTLITVNREITKLNEEVIYGTVDEVSDYINSDEFIQKGEFVIVIENNVSSEQITDETLLFMITEKINEGQKIKTVSSQLASELNLNKNYIYDLYVKNKEKSV